MRVLITGVSGFLGVPMARRFVAAGHRVFGTYVGDPPSVDGIDSVRADLLDPTALRDAVDRARPDVVVHLAGLSHVGESWDRAEEYRRINVDGTERLLSAAEGCRVVLASSAQVYGPVAPRSQPIREEMPLNPRNPYAESKAEAERLVLAAGGTGIRLFNVVGPGQAPNFALPSFASQLAALRGVEDPVLRVGDLSPRRDFLPLSDAIEGYLTVVEHGDPGAVYNLGSGVAVSIAEALEVLIEVSGVRPRVEVESSRLRAQEVPLLYADIRRLEALGWAPQSDLRRALEDLWSSLTDPF